MDSTPPALSTGAIRDLAAQVLATGRDRLQRLEIEPDAASYIGITGHAVIGADRVVGRLGWPELPAQIIADAQSMLGSRRTAHRTYGTGNDGRTAGVQVWMQSHPESDPVA